MQYFPQFAGPDMALGIPITSAGDGLGGPDLRTVIGATIFALKPDLVTTLTWTATIVAAPGQSVVTATVAMLRYAFTGTELDQLQTWRASWLLALSDVPNTWPENPKDTSIFGVVDKFGRY